MNKEVTVGVRTLTRMASRINIYSQLAISPIRIIDIGNWKYSDIDIANSNC